MLRILFFNFKNCVVPKRNSYEATFVTLSRVAITGSGPTYSFTYAQLGRLFEHLLNAMRKETGHFGKFCGISAAHSSIKSYFRIYLFHPAFKMLENTKIC